MVLFYCMLCIYYSITINMLLLKCATSKYILGLQIIFFVPLICETLSLVVVLFESDVGFCVSRMVGKHERCLVSDFEWQFVIAK